MSGLNEARLRNALDLVQAERRRQEAKCAVKRAEGEDWRTPADPLCTDLMRWEILLEEIGEVAKERNEARAAGEITAAELRKHLERLRAELVQCAASAVAWAEHLS